MRSSRLSSDELSWTICFGGDLTGGKKVWAPLKVRDFLMLEAEERLCWLCGVKLWRNFSVRFEFQSPFFRRSLSERLKMNWTSEAYSPHLCSTLRGASEGASSLSLSLHLSTRVKRPVLPVAWASAMTTSWHVVASVTPQITRWMPSTQTFNSILCQACMHKSRLVGII